jgi:hypothetical protein
MTTKPPHRHRNKTHARGDKLARQLARMKAIKQELRDQLKETDQ